MLVRLSGDRKRLVSSAVTTHSTTSVISGIWPDEVEALAPSSSADGGVQPLFVEARRRARCAPMIVPWRSASIAVANARELGEIARDTSTPPPRAAKSRISAWICALAATSTPCVGSSSSSTPTLRASHLARMTFCWLPPDSAAAGSAALRGRMSSSSISSATSRSPARAIEQAGARQAVEARQQDVVAHRQVHRPGRAAARPAPCRCRSGWRRPGLASRRARR